MTAVKTAKSMTRREAAREKQMQYWQTEIKRSHTQLINSKLDPELQDCVCEYDDGDVGIDHRFYKSSDHKEASNHEANCRLKLKRLQVEEAVENKNWQRVIDLHEKPFRGDAFEEYMHNFDDKTYWSILVDVYTMTEFHYYDLDLWQSLLSSTRPGREHMMTVEEREYLASLARSNSQSIAATIREKTSSERPGPYPRIGLPGLVDALAVTAIDRR